MNRDGEQGGEGLDFTLEAYGAIVAAIVERGYEIVPFAEAEPTKQHLILRHDVDFDLERAVAMAEFEQSHGLHACYFVLLRTEFYNIASSTAVAQVRRLAELGHEVGLHFDAAFYPESHGSLNEAVFQEVEILRLLTGLPIASISLHRPHPSLIENGLQIEPLINTYAETYFKEFGYCSDSNGGWHHGHPLQHEALQQSRGLQLLTHPIWWVGGEGRTPLETLMTYLDEKQGVLDHHLTRNCKLFRAFREHTKR
ncbi:MAG: hypothetical protein HQL50_05845 [Magnetococcales bacterium]|nr:hypothetical protein [Magnetococcales bacterium]